MRLRILSDIHLETSVAWTLPSQADGPPFDVAVVAGDVAPGVERSIEWLGLTFPRHPVIYVVGDLEVGVGDVLTEIDKAEEAAAGTNIRFLHNNTTDLQDAGGTEVTFVGAPLWTDFGLFGKAHAKQAIAAAARLRVLRTARMDFHARRLSASDIVGWHRRSRAFIGTELRRHRAGRVVLVTHHAAHRMGGPALDPATGFVDPPPPDDEGWLAATQFNADLPIFGAGLDLAVSGHVHRGVDAYVAGTRVVANPKGYGPWFSGRGRSENSEFDPYFTIEI